VILLNVVWDQVAEETAVPVALLLHPLTNEVPKLLVGLDELLVLVDLDSTFIVGLQLQVLLL
jgi:hypothetical protein